ncbi:Ninja-family protein afp2 [Thalictrum thalictroides]|uniref:Ninja-family protein n=1 Tax=Thalictrum thalictroides TaxID=46969 RepID=A0A7J6WZW8_THATH|nr:Ninja-family protein afp2 [Thalictrum thalictroides]
MGEAKGVDIREVEQLATQINGYPRDLLKGFTATNHHQSKFTEAKHDNEEIELNLGLSLGGRFGVDPKERELVRSSSIAGLTTFLREDDASAPPSVVFPLIRTSSLPMESEEEWRKRKELQSLRRFEAKRKRCEKQKNIRLSKDRTSLERNCDDKRGDEEGFSSMILKGKVEANTSFLGNTKQQLQFMIPNGFSPMVTPPFGMPNWASSVQGSVLDSSPNGKTNVLAAAAAQGFLPPPTPQGSVGSHGSSSSGISEFESRPVQGIINLLLLIEPIVKSLSVSCNEVLEYILKPIAIILSNYCFYLNIEFGIFFQFEFIL